MADRLLYHTPGSCSRVALNALEEIGLPYGEKTLALDRGAQYAADFLAINPKGKVPVLVEDGVAITELPVILYHLANLHPGAVLLPSGADGRARLEGLSDLIWIAGALHPAAARLFRPEAVSAADPAGAKAIAMAQLVAHAAAISKRLGDRGWWYGERWSITDTFFAWAFGFAGQFGFPLGDFPALAANCARVEARPSFVRARAKEQDIAARDAIVMPPGMRL